MSRKPTAKRRQPTAKSRQPKAESRQPRAVVLLSTWPADRDAAPFARALVEERLAACVSVLEPMMSTYRWQGAIEQSAERQVIIKTTAAQVEALTTRVQALHPYDVPELLVLPIEGGSDAYLRWVEESVERTAR